MAMEEIEETIEILKEFEEIEITEWKWHIDRNYAYLEGKIKNNHSIPISYVKVEVVYKDKNEDILDTDWTYAVGSHPYNGHVKSFSMMTPYSDGMEKAYIEVVSFRKISAYYHLIVGRLFPKIIKSKVQMKKGMIVWKPW